MRTKNTVQIVRADMEATSQDCDFNVKEKKFFLRTNVKVLLKHFNVGSGTPGTPKAGTPGAATPQATGAAPVPAPSGNASPQPTVDTLTPIPPDESIMPSPGAYSDTNAAPLPPANSTK